jgi:enoyl-CoA hydratase
LNRSDSEPSTVGPSLIVESRGTTRVLTLNRPSALNALDPDLVSAIDAALDDAQADACLTAVILTGMGRAFCAGADLKAARARASAADGDAASAAFVGRVTALMTRLERFPCPVIAAVQGIAVAGGLELALCCDIVIASDGARFGDGHANYGLLPGGGGSVRLPRRIGSSRAKYLMFSGELLPAVELERWGLVNAVVPDDALLPHALRLADRFATKSPLGLRRMKRLVDDGLELPIDDALRNEQQVSAEHARSDDRREGLAAFAEGRPPVFVGR